MNSSGSGAIPYRRYSPRPASAAELVTLIYRGDSSTDSKVWMREEICAIKSVDRIRPRIISGVFICCQCGRKVVLCLVSFGDCFGLFCKAREKYIS